MLNHIRMCLSWLDWKLGAVIALVVGGVTLCLGWLNLSRIASVTPLLLLAACLLPCLLPFTLLRRNKA
jgi:hypothetical protein